MYISMDIDVERDKFYNGASINGPFYDNVDYRPAQVKRIVLTEGGCSGGERVPFVPEARLRAMERIIKRLRDDRE